MKADDVATMDAVKSGLALHVGNGGEAIAMAQQAIDLWTQAHGPAYFLLSNVYLLRAQALAHCRDYVSAIRDAQHALTIVEAAIGRDTIDFLSAQVVYADPASFGSEAGRVAHGQRRRQRTGGLEAAAMQRMYDRCQRVQVNGMTMNFNAHVAIF